MKGKKIGIMVGVIGVLMSLLAMNASAVATHTLTATPATAAWGDTEYIVMTVAQNDWNGTAWCNLTTPNGDVVRLGGQAMNGWAATVTWTYIPNIPGAWTVTVEFQKAAGAATIPTHTTTFTQERTMVSVARNVIGLGPAILYVAIVLILAILLFVIVGRVSDRSGKVK